jgi:hypothetical protein
MKLLSTAAAFGLACFSSTGFAYEFENGVPLTLGFQLGETTVKGVHIRLTGHDVEMAISLRNDTQQAQYAGFYANTLLFENHGEGEENSDKSFSDLKAFHDGKPVQVSSYQRSYFLGQDITDILRSAGVDPLPSNNGDYCGSPAKLRNMIRRAAQKETLVLAEVFEFPLPFIALQETRVTVGKPDKKLPGGRRFAALACGFDGTKAVPSDGVIRRATYSISILVVSLLE